MITIIQYLTDRRPGLAVGSAFSPHMIDIIRPISATLLIAKKMPRNFHNSKGQITRTNPIIHSESLVATSELYQETRSTKSTTELVYPSILREEDIVPGITKTDSCMSKSAFEARLNTLPMGHNFNFKILCEMRITSPLLPYDAWVFRTTKQFGRHPAAYVMSVEYSQIIGPPAEDAEIRITGDSPFFYPYNTMHSSALSHSLPDAHIGNLERLFAVANTVSNICLRFTESILVSCSPHMPNEWKDRIIAIFGALPKCEFDIQ